MIAVFFYVFLILFFNGLGPWPGPLHGLSHLSFPKMLQDRNYYAQEEESEAKRLENSD